MLTIAIHDQGRRYYRATVTPEWAARHDNGALISLGLSVGHDLTRRAFNALSKTEITYAEWNHMGCQSSCTQRGQATCSW